MNQISSPQKTLSLNNKTSVAKRFIVMIVLFSGVMTFVGTAIRLYFNYEKELREINNQIEQIQQTHLQSIINSLWVTDFELLEIEMRGILTMRDIESLEIIKDGKKIIKVGLIHSKETKTKSFPLSYSFKGKNVGLGTLHVVAGLDGIYGRSRDNAVEILTTQALQIFFITIFISFIFHFLIGRHLKTMASYSSQLRLNYLATPLLLKGCRNKDRPDELDQVVSSVNTMLVSLGNDLEERRRAVEEKEKLIAELENKNAELERFTYTVSHDLKSPLVTISGFAGLLEKDVLNNNPEKIKRDIKQIHNAAEKMKLLLDDLLELSRVGRIVNPPQEVQLNALVRDALSMVAGQINERGVDVSIRPDLPEVFVDRTRILEVFQNLIDNAIKFMGEQPEPKIEIGARRDSSNILCYIKDNGVGINPHYHKKVFDLFDKLNPQAKGTGIGLTLVKRIVEEHGGSIWVESDGLNNGTTFFFRLPQKGEFQNHA